MEGSDSGSSGVDKEEGGLEDEQDRLLLTFFMPVEGKFEIKFCIGNGIWVLGGGVRGCRIIKLGLMDRMRFMGRKCFIFL